MAGLALLAFVVRLALGMQEALDADEATEAITALRLLHGHLALMESNGRYLGAAESYLLAPALAVLGPTLLAVRLTMSLLGALYVVAMTALGRLALGSPTRGLAVGAVAVVFPFFSVSFGVRARGYGVALLLEALLLLMWLRGAWAPRPAGVSRWLLAGLVAGLGLWAHPLLALPLAMALAAVLARAPTNGWSTTARGLGLAGVGALVGLLPWLAYNLALSPLGSLRHLYSPAVAYTTSPAVAVHGLLEAGLPILVGARVSSCGAAAVPLLPVDLTLGAWSAGLLWMRRRSLVALSRGRIAELEAIDFVLAVAPLSLLVLTLGPFNALFCEPRYLLPAAVPLALAAALMISSPLPWRLPALALAAGWLIVATGVARQTALLDRDLLVTPHGAVRVDAAAAAAQIQALRPEALWAQYWLARPIQYYSGDRLVVGEYEGYIGFPDTQRRALAAAHPSWLFVESDPEAVAFRAECARRGIAYRESRPQAGLLLFSDLSAPLTPGDLGLGGQRLERV